MVGRVPETLRRTERSLVRSLDLPRRAGTILLARRCRETSGQRRHLRSIEEWRRRCLRSGLRPWPRASTSRMIRHVRRRGRLRPGNPEPRWSVTLLAEKRWDRRRNSECHREAKTRHPPGFRLLERWQRRLPRRPRKRRFRVGPLAEDRSHARRQRSRHLRWRSRRVPGDRCSWQDRRRRHRQLPNLGRWRSFHRYAQSESRCHSPNIRGPVGLRISASLLPRFMSFFLAKSIPPRKSKAFCLRPRLP